MTHYDLASPSAAERYFDASIFGQLYRVMADGLGAPAGRRLSDSGRRGAPAVAAPRRTGILDRLDRWFWRQEQKAREAYLAGSADVFELERRIRAMERGEITRYY
jgi:hypothetical protein